MSDISTPQILKDTADALIVKWALSQSDANQESHSQVANAAALRGAVINLSANTDDANTYHIGVNGFIPGETVIGANTGVSAALVAYNRDTGVMSVINMVPFDANTTSFTESEVVRGLLSNSHVTLLGNSAVNLAAYSLDIESLEFSIPDGGRVDIEWEGVDNTANAAYVIATSLSGTGYLGKNFLASLFTQPAANSTFTPNGSISISTLGLTANGGYTIIAEIRKGHGYAVVPDERVRDK